MNEGELAESCSEPLEVHDVPDQGRTSTGPGEPKHQETRRDVKVSVSFPGGEPCEQCPVDFTLPSALRIRHVDKNSNTIPIATWLSQSQTSNSQITFLPGPYFFFGGSTGV